MWRRCPARRRPRRRPRRRRPTARAGQTTSRAGWAARECPGGRGTGLARPALPGRGWPSPGERCLRCRSRPIFLSDAGGDAQLPQHGEPAASQAAHARLAAAEQRRDLMVGQVLVVPQHERRALPRARWFARAGFAPPGFNARFILWPVAAAFGIGLLIALIGAWLAARRAG